MRILIHGINYAPDEIGIPKYTTEMAEWLAARGHEVRVITAPPYYPAWSVPKEYRSVFPTRCERNGVRLVRCPIYVPETPSGLKRILHLASFALSSAVPALWVSLTWRPQIVFGVAPALTSAPVSWLAARLVGAAAWLHIQDFELDAAYEMGLLKNARARTFAETIERWILRRFDRVSTISAKMMDGLNQKGVNLSAIRELRNWVDISAIHPTATTSPYRLEWHVTERDIVCLYSGNIANKQGMEIILEAADILRPHAHIKFVVCGAGSGRDEFARQAEGRPNIRMLPLQPFEQLNDLLNAADIHMLPQKAGAADLVLPSKLTGMLASGRPVVATATADSGLAAEITQCGISTEPDNAQAFANAILALANDDTKRGTLGAAARKAAETRLDINAILTRAEADLSDVAASRLTTTPSPSSEPRQGK